MLRHATTRYCQRNPMSLFQRGQRSKCFLVVLCHLYSVLQTGNLWRYTTNGSWWVHSNAVIRVLPKINTHFETTFLTRKWEIPISVSPPINGSALLVSVNDRFLWTRSTFCKLFITYIYSRQRDMFRSGPTNPGGTRKPDNLLKGIRNPISWNPDKPFKEIQDLVQKWTRSQCPIGLTVPT